MGCYSIASGREGIGNEYLKMVKKKSTVLKLLIKTLSVVGLHELQVLRKAKQSSVMYVTLAGRQRQALRRRLTCWCHVLKPLTQICTFILLKKLAEAFQGSFTSHKCYWRPPSTRQRTTTHTYTFEIKEAIKNIPHLPHSPHRASSDLHRYGALKDAIRAKMFGSELLKN